MRKILFGLGFSLALLLGAAALIGLSPSYIAAAPAVATGIGAKLLCSARYVSHFDEQQALDDLVQYSPILKYLHIEYDENNKSVHTDLFGLHPTSAQYIEGIGCANHYPNVQHHLQQAHALADSSAAWPRGNAVHTLNNDMMTLLAEQLKNDNRAGLNTRALLVAQHGRIIAEAYGQGAGPDTPLLGWSMAKSLMSIMIGNLEHRGLIDSTRTPIFAQWASDPRRNIQLTHLLQMTDGLEFSEQYNPGDDATAMLFTRPSASDYALAKPLGNRPGVHFNYSSGTANLLSRLYFEHTGASLQASYDDYSEHIAKPLGFAHAVFETDASGVFVGSSYFYASARDWARLGQLMLDGGVINRQRLVSSAWVRQSTQANQSENDKAYGYQWWLNSGNEELRWPDLPNDSFAAQGNRQQNMMIIPSKDAVIVRLGWTSGRYPVNEQFAQIVEALQ